MPSSNRRRFLGIASAALTGLAGCAGDLTTDSDGTTTDDGTSTTDTTTPTDTSTTDDGTSTTPEPDSPERTLGDVVVDVTDATVRKAVAYESIMGSGGVIAPDGQQFVVAAVRSGTGSSRDATGAPSYDSFDLVVDDETYPAIDIEDRTTGAYTTSLAGRGEIRYDAPYAEGSGAVGWAAFELPSPLDVADAAIRCRYGGETAEWTLSDDQVAALGRPAPDFELRSFEATANEFSVDVSLVVENVSGTDGRFLAAVYWPTSIADDDESTIVDRSVAAGDRVEWSQTFYTEYAGGGDSADGNDTVTVRVDGPVTAERTVELDSGTTTGN